MFSTTRAGLPGMYWRMWRARSHALALVIGGPGIGRDVGDAVVSAAQIGAGAEPLLQHVVEPAHLGLVTAERILVPGRREILEVGELPEHRPDAGQLDHQPLQHL